jgi:hypothetical protein
VLAVLAVEIQESFVTSKRSPQRCLPISQPDLRDLPAFRSREPPTKQAAPPQAPIAYARLTSFKMTK